MGWGKESGEVGDSSGGERPPPADPPAAPHERKDSIAATAAAADSLIASLGRSIECAICLDRLNTTNNRTLPCQHTYHLHCLRKSIERDGELRCPECRRLCEVPVDQLLPNYSLNKVLESLPPDVSDDWPGFNAQGLPMSTAFLYPGFNDKLSSFNGAPHKLPLCRALYDYRAQQPVDLSFKRGDLIRLTQQIDTNWYRGELLDTGIYGCFPANYIQVINPLPTPTCVALYDFFTSEGQGCLTFKRGAVITVIDRVDEFWARGTVGSRAGIFPLNFVSLNEFAKDVMNEWAMRHHKFDCLIPAGSSSGGPGSPAAAAAAAGQPVQLPLPFIPFSRPPLKVASKKHGPAGGQRTEFSKRHSTGSSVQSSANRVERAMSPVIGPEARQASSNQDLVSHRSFTAAVDISSPVLVSSTNPSASRRLGSGENFSEGLGVHLALYDYWPDEPDELRLTKGDCYTVEERCEDGWCRGLNNLTGQRGTFPGNFVCPFDSLPSAAAIHQSASRQSSSPRSPGGCPISPPSPRRAFRPIKLPADVIGCCSPLGTPKPSRAPISVRRFHSFHGTRHGGPVRIASREPVASESLSIEGAVGSNEFCDITPKREKKSSASSLMKKIRGSRKSPRREKSPAEPTEAMNPSDRAPLIPPHMPNSGHITSRVYRVTESYPPQNDSEVELRIGDLIFESPPSQSRGDGFWLHGLNSRSGLSGYFPSTFVQPHRASVSGPRAGDLPPSHALNTFL